MEVSEDHNRKLERLYVAAPTNEYYKPEISISRAADRLAVVAATRHIHLSSPG